MHCFALISTDQLSHASCAPSSFLGCHVRQLARAVHGSLSVNEHTVLNTRRVSKVRKATVGYLPCTRQEPLPSWHVPRRSRGPGSNAWRTGLPTLQTMCGPCTSALVSEMSS